MGDIESTYNVEQNEKASSTFGDIANKQSNSSTVNVEKELSNVTSTEEVAGDSSQGGRTRKRFVLQNRKN